jgi:hypothetical protein
MGNRIFYACQQAGIAIVGTTAYTPIRGLQSIGMTTTFDLEKIFQIGMLSLYENIEQIPDIEVTLEKVLDGNPLIYHLATQGSPATTLTGRSAIKCMVGVSIFQDTQDAASGAPVSQVVMSGMSVSSLSFTFPVEGSFTESVTLIGNDKVWSTSAPYSFSGAFLNTETPPGAGGVNQRQDMLFTPLTNGTDVNGAASDVNCTVLPGGTNGIPGITSSGTNSTLGTHVQNISCSVDLGREAIFELGRRAPYFRFIGFPVDVTTDIEVLSTQGDLISATEAGYVSAGVNQSDKTIRIATAEGTRINLGTKNKLANVSYGGGDTGGGNVTVTYSYTNANDFAVAHTGDPTVALRAAYHNPY